MNGVFMTMARLHFSQRDLKTNLANIRTGVISESISNSQYRISQLNESRYEVKLKVPNNVLNPEEASLLRDAGPNVRMSASGITFNWVFPKRFYEENKDNLKELLCERLNRDVKQEYEARKDMMSGRTLSPQAAVDKKPPLHAFSRLLNALQRDRQSVSTGYEMGM